MKKGRRDREERMEGEGRKEVGIGRKGWKEREERKEG